MSGSKTLRAAGLVALALALVLPDVADAARRRRATHEASGHLTFASPQADPVAISPDGTLVLVAATTSNRVDAIATATDTVVGHVPVGMDPVSVAFRPDGQEAWVSNHVSDSVSVIDTNPASASYLEVVETVQSLAGGVTLFDEPVGIAFAENGEKAYVALSSTNEIAVVDTALCQTPCTPYEVSDVLSISAQEPRAMVVRGGRLFVAAFESFNKSELSVCGNLTGTGGVGDQCSMGLQELLQFITNPNVPAAVKNIVIDPQVPDRDLFVFRTSDDQLLEAVSGVGTLLYGLAVSSGGDVFVSQADARNAENGDDGEFLVALDNRMFLNQVTRVDCGGGDGNPCGSPTRFDLEPAPPSQPALSNALATPYGVQVSGDDSTLVLTAAGTSRVFTLNPTTGAVLDILDLEDPGVSGDEGQQIPRGVALWSKPDAPGQGAPLKAYVLNTLDNSVTVVDVSNPSNLVRGARIPVGDDPTPDAVRRGRIAFNNAFGSSTGTFSCASCHPDGNTDQLLWRIGGDCTAIGCPPGDEPRSTMPIRGLRDTVPLHWDGTLGDPFGGRDGSTASNLPPSCDVNDPHTCFRDLVEASFSGVMCDQTGSCPVCDTQAQTCPSGALLSNAEREDMATFLERVSYPPARSRSIDDAVTATAVTGFEDFFMDQGNGGNPDTCADSNAGCHELPLGTATNSETLAGFDAPTMRGMTDRTLQFSLGPTNAEELLVLANSGFNLFGFVASPLEPELQWDPNNVGFSEATTFGAAFLAFEGVYNSRPPGMLQMFEEASTGHSGATGRQVTLNTRTTGASLLATTDALLADLEAADLRGVVNLRGRALRGGTPVTISYKAGIDLYQVGGQQMDRATLLADAQIGLTLATLTAHLRNAVDEDAPQPLISPVGGQCGTGNGATGDPALPTGSSFQLEAAHVGAGDVVFLNGQPTGATLSLAGTSSSCTATQGQVTPDLIQISGLSRTGGTDLLQVWSASSGLLSNEIPLP